MSSLLASTQRSYPASLLLHFDGANNSTTFTDSSSQAMTLTSYNNPVISTTQSKIGNTSIYIPEYGYIITTNTISIAYNQDFTVELWVFNTESNTAAQPGIFKIGSHSLYLHDNSRGIFTYDNDVSEYVLEGNHGIRCPLNEWAHISLVRFNGNLKLYLNGRLLESVSFPNSISGQITIGNSLTGSTEQFSGYIDEFRITKGIALYQVDYFTPTSVLLLSNSTIPPKLYNHIVMVSNKSSGNITGNITTSSGYYTVNWWDGTKTTYSSGANFAKTAIGGNQSITIYPSSSNGSLDGYFYNVDVSDNNLTSVRPLYSRFVVGLAIPGYSTYGYVGYPYYYSIWFWVPGIPGATYHLNVSSNSLDSSALNQIYTDLLNGNGTIDVSDNTGGDSDNPSIATAKGYTVYGSLSPYTTLLLNLNSNYTDSSSQNVSISVLGGSPSFSTSIKKYGSAALSFNGGNVGNDSLIIPDLSQVDYTIEFWIYRPTATAAYEGIINLSNGSTSYGINIHLYTSNDIHFNNGQAGAVSGGTINATQWYHVACVSRNNVKKLFINGILVSSATQATPAGPYKIKIGATYGLGYTSNAYIDDIRIIRGKALYTGDFIVPSSELTTSTSSISAGVTRLLLNFTGTNNSTVFTDSSSSNHTVTPYGNAKISTTQSKPSGGSSGYFDGTGDYLDIPYNTVFNLSSGPWTLEAWFYATSLPSDMTVSSVGIISKDRNGSSFDYNINVAQNGILFGCNNLADSSSLLFCYTTISTNIWHHVAIVSDGLECRVYLNGILINSKTFSGSFIMTNATNSNISIGCNSSINNPNAFFTGYIDDVRIIRGRALYSSNFTPLSSQLTTTI